MTGIVKTDQLQGAQGTTVTIPTGNTLAVTSNATVGGTLGVTGAVTLGTKLATTNLATGAVVQVVSNTNSNTANSGAFLLTTSSASFTAAALSASITPTSTSSKIMIMISTNHYRAGSSSVTIFRGSTNLGGSSFGMNRMTGAQAYWMPISLLHLDSPNTTSTITYQLYARSESGTLYIGGDGDMKNNIILTEIAG